MLCNWLSLALVLVGLIKITAQEYPWSIDVNYGIAQHDKRSLGYPDVNMLFEKHPEFYGTYSYGLRVQRAIWEENDLGLKVGVGYTFRRMTLTRPFDHSRFGRDDFKILRFASQYRKHIFTVSVSPYYSLGKHWSLGVDVNFNTEFYTSVDWAGEFYGGMWDVNFHSIELIPRISCRVGRWYGAFGVRAMNFQRKDAVIYRHSVRDSNTELHNPVKLLFATGYALGT